MIRDEDIARSHQLALDMQMAYDLEEREVAEQQQRRDQLSSNGIPSSSAVLVQGTTSTAVRSSAPTETDGYCTGFSSDHMLYVACEVEGRLVEMLVDSGASSSAISKGEMQRLNLQSKLNTRFAGKAVGCGSANVLVIVENVIVSIGHAEFRLFFLVLDTEHPLRTS